MSKTSAQPAFLNRELSWLAFNERVLGEAARAELPVLERAKFLAITASNLDEFFMVRVGGLQLLKDSGKRVLDPSGMTPTRQLDAIRARVKSFILQQYEVLNGHILPELSKHGVRRLRPADLTPAQRVWLQDYFMSQVQPVLSPVAMDEKKDASIAALQIALLCRVRSGEERRIVLIMLPPVLQRHVTIPGTEADQHHYMNLEDVVSMFISELFPGETVEAVLRFRLSRNTDIAVDDENAYDLATEMEEVIEARRDSAAIRIEVEQPADRALMEAVKRICGSEAHTYLIPGELDLRSCFALAALPGRDDLRVAAWDSQPSTALASGGSLFSALQHRDILLHHPYESFDPVVQLVEEAAADPDVLAIKQILYRTAKNSRIIGALIKAAQSGKAVTVLVELKARFDEARNLERAEELIHAGAQIIYGVRGLKTHAKITLVMRRESGHMARYCHFGTGNYNEATARLYTDISYLTRRADYGSDASAFFNTVTGRSRYQAFARLSMAPFGLRNRLLDLVQSETERARQGEPAEITLKMNSLEDQEMIQALYKASSAGVKVRLNVRGICCLKPGVPKLSENIRVVSVIDRYLEHARIFAFHQGGNAAVFIASADLMTRNLSKRVELMVPIADAAAKKRLLHILESHFEDDSQAHELLSDGTWRALSGGKHRCQRAFAQDAARRYKAERHSPDTLVPHLPKE